MGLDSVEILMNVEDTFGITISDYEAEKIATVGDIHNLVWRTLQGRQSMRCRSQQLFYKIRHTLATKFNISRDVIELEASLNDIFPQANRRLLYRKLEKELQLNLPALELPTRWKIILRITTLLLIPGMGGLSLIKVNGLAGTKWWYLLPGLGLVLTVFFSNLLDPVRTVFEPAALKQYTLQVLSLNYGTLIQEHGADRNEMEMVINNIIADKAGVEIEEVTPEKDLYDDLGVN